MTRWIAVLCIIGILLAAHGLADRDAIILSIWIGSIISTVIGTLRVSKTADRVEPRKVGLNLLATVALFMSLRYASPSGFIISQVRRLSLICKLNITRNFQIASFVVVRCFHEKQSLYYWINFGVVIAAVILQMRNDGLALLMCCAYCYLEYFNENLEDNTAIRTKLYSSIILSVLSLPLTLMGFANQSPTATSALSMLILAICFAFYNWNKQQIADKVHMAIGLSVTGAIIIATSRSFEAITLIAYALVLIAFFMSQRFKTPEEHPSSLSSNEDKRSNLIPTVLAAMVVIGFTVIFSLSITTTEFMPPAVQFTTLSIDAYDAVPYSAVVIPEDKTKNSLRLQCLSNARKMIVERVSKLLDDSEALSLVDIPMHWNLGDSFIWHGDNIFTSLQGLPVVNPADKDQRELTDLHSIEKLALLLHGGGNFGDWWRENADFRLKVVEEMPNNRVIFLPQSIHYRDDKYVVQDRQAFEKHNKLTLLLRDNPSLQFAKENFPNTESIFVPDMAFMIGSLPAAEEPLVDIIFLLRTDTEKNINDTHLDSAKLLAQEKLMSYEIWDFPVDGYPIPNSISSRQSALYDYRKLYPNIGADDIPKDILPMFRVAMGNKLLSRGSIIITDRLHASIMGVLIGRPVIYVDNAYKKLSNIWSSMASQIDACNGENLRAQHVDTLDRAVELAFDLVRETRR